MSKYPLNLPPTRLNVTLLLIPSPEADITFPAPHWIGEVVDLDQVLPQVCSGCETLLTFITRPIFLYLELAQELRVISLRVLNKSSLGHKILPTEGTREVSAACMF